MSDQPSLFLPTVLDPVGEEGLSSLRKRCSDCVKCELAKLRTQTVFGEGKVDRPDLCFVGEAPGAQEDTEGRPFIGKSGRFLTKVIAAMGYKREDVYLCNVVACRPPDNRTPEKKEIEACHEYLLGQVRAVRPKIIVALGGTASFALLGKKKITEVRGKWQEFNGTPVMPTFHPSAIVRAEKEPNYEDLKRIVWGDMLQVLTRLDKR